MQTRLVVALALASVPALVSYQAQESYESLPSVAVRVPEIIVKWDYDGTSLEDVRRYRWAAHIDGQRVELPDVVCGPPTGKTPPTSWSCEVTARPEWAGKQVSVSAYLPMPPLPPPAAVRVWLSAPVESGQPVP